MNQRQHNRNVGLLIISTKENVRIATDTLKFLTKQNFEHRCKMNLSIDAYYMYISRCQAKKRKMQLTKHTDYAFRVLIYLAAMDEQRTTIQTISDVYDLSKTHLMKVVNALSNKGWIDSVRGKNGGISLGIAAEEIKLREVLELMENNLEPINCNDPPCHIRGVCLLKPILMQAQSDYLNCLGKYSLADVVNDGTIDRMKTHILRKM